MRRTNIALAAVVVVVVLSGSASPQGALPGDADLAKSALGVLSTFCAGCHSPAAKKIKGDFGFVTDLQKLSADREKIAAGDPDASELYRRLKVDDRDRMPPAGEARPSSVEADTIRDWIKSLKPKAQARRFVSDDDVLKLMQEDLGTLSKAKRRTTRYLTLTHLYNEKLKDGGAAVSDADLALYREGVTKLLNSLSSKSRLTKPRELGDHRSVLAFDLLDLGWTEADWLRILEIYPYAFLSDSPAFHGVVGASGIQSKDGKLLPPFIRGDWFAAFGSKPPLYHDLLKLPKTLDELAKANGVEITEGIKTERALRAGFQKSRVSQGNRVIERHESKYGAFWVSYDFKQIKTPDEGGDPKIERRKDLFECPIGPASAFSGAQLDGHVFDHAGGEVIFNLPNGLQAYLLVDSKGTRIDAGPQDIVQDNDSRDHVVLNGISCMSCHVGGMQAAQDTLREHVVDKAAAAFPKGVVDAVRSLHADSASLKKVLDEDTKRFKDALGAASVRLDEGREPVRALVDQFERPLDFFAASAELGFDAADFVARLDRTPELKKIRSQLERDGVPRNKFISVFAELVKLLELGDLVIVPKVDEKVKPKDDGTKDTSTKSKLPSGFEQIGTAVDGAGRPMRIRHSATGIVMVLVPGGTFTMGSNESAAEKPMHAVTLKPFWLSETETTFGQWKRYTSASGYAATGSAASDVHPVVEVSFDDCQSLISFYKGDGLRLPTEAEWEYAARAGSTSRWFFGGLASGLAEFAWFSDNASAKIQPVGKKKSNPFGLYDIYGNVWEWCQDSFVDNYAGAPADGSAREGVQPQHPVFRGGCVMVAADFARSSYRGSGFTNQRDALLGFRLAHSAP